MDREFLLELIAVSIAFMRLNVSALYADTGLIAECILTRCCVLQIMRNMFTSLTTK